MSDETTPGEPGPAPPAPGTLSGRDLARAALETAKEDARARRREREGRRAAGRRAEGARSRRPARESDADGEPMAFGAAVQRWVDSRGYDADLAVARVLGAWETVVGEQIAQHSRPQGLRDGELHVEADSTAWATQLRLLERPLLGAIAATLGEGVVSSLRVHGPTGPGWGHGMLRVPGRGQRDTYG